MPSATHSKTRPILGLLTLAIAIFSMGCLAVAGGTGAFAEDPVVIGAGGTEEPPVDADVTVRDPDAHGISDQSTNVQGAAAQSADDRPPAVRDPDAHGISDQSTNVQGNDDRATADDPSNDRDLWLPSPRTLFHSTIHRAEEGRIELGDGSIIQIDSRHVLSSAVLLNQTYLLLARRGADIWIEDYGVFLGRVIQAPQRFIDEVPFHQCHVEKLIAGGRVLLTEDREVYEIDTFDQSHASRVLGPAVPLWVVENEIILPLRSGGRIIEVVRHW